MAVSKERCPESVSKHSKEKEDILKGLLPEKWDEERVAIRVFVYFFY